MKSVIFKSEHKEKLDLLIRIAREMGIVTVVQYPENEEPDVAIASESSLNEAWNSKEDERWDELYIKNKK